MEPASSDNNYHYNSKLQNQAKYLRQSMTKGEACLWKYQLRNRQMMGYQFRRQRPILNYIADFVCLDLLLIIEVDGITHETEEQYLKDQERNLKLETVGFTTLRFSNWEVLNRLAGVSELICAWITANAQSPPPGPRQRGRINNKLG